MVEIMVKISVEVDIVVKIKVRIACKIEDGITIQGANKVRWLEGREYASPTCTAVSTAIKSRDTVKDRIVVTVKDRIVVTVKDRIVVTVKDSIEVGDEVVVKILV